MESTSIARLQLFSTETEQPKNQRSNFVSNLVENLKEELKRNKELQDNKRQLEERIKQLNESHIREKYNKISKETVQSAELIKHTMNQFSDYANAVLADIRDTKAGKETLKQLHDAAETVGRAAQAVGNTKVYRQVTYFAKEVDRIADVRLYCRPEELKMRTSEFSDTFANRVIEANTTATGVELHKDSRWYAGWKSISESHYMNLIYDWKHRFDESESLLARAVRTTMDRLSNTFSSSNKVSEVLTEITKVDPTFNKLEWLRFCEVELVPNILEAWIRMDLDVLNDWCMERAYKPLAASIEELHKIGYHTLDSRILDLSKVDVVGGELKDVGPILLVQFNVTMVSVVKNAEGKVIEGDAKKAVKFAHVWALCRDLENYNPATAWRVVEIAYSPLPFTV